MHLVHLQHLQHATQTTESSQTTCLHDAQVLSEIFFVSSLLARPWCEINFCSPEVAFFNLPYISGKASLILSKLFSQVSGFFCYFYLSFLKDKIIFQTYPSVESQGSQMLLTVSLTVLSGVTRK